MLLNVINVGMMYVLWNEKCRYSFLDSNSITALPSAVFSGLTALTTLFVQDILIGKLITLEQQFVLRIRIIIMVISNNLSPIISYSHAQ